MNKITKLTQLEFARQRDTLNLIASENYPSSKVLELLGSVWQNRYAEGSPGKRYYAGQVYVDELETYVQNLALEVFDAAGEYAVNVQLLSGSPANTMVYMAMLEPGDTILSLKLANGGHLSHLHETSSYNKFFKHITYDVEESAPDDFRLDMVDFAKKLKQYKPKLTIIGFSAYPHSYEFAELCRLAHASGSIVLADIAHINGLVAAGLHDSPFKVGDEGADFVSMTTHKTMRGPRGAMLFSKQKYIDQVNKTIFPGTSGGPHIHQIAATGQALLEILGRDQHPDGCSFREYSESVIRNAQVMEKGAMEAGLSIVSPTQTHLSLIRLPDEVDSLELQARLDEIGIVLNRNMIPNDVKSAWRPSGLRVGSAALTSRGLTANNALAIGNLIAEVALGKTSDDKARKQVKKIITQLTWWYT